MELGRNYALDNLKVFLAVLVIALFTSLSTMSFAQTKHIVKLGTGIMSLESVGSYPQKLIEVCENSDSAVIVRISTFNEWEDDETVAKLRPTPYNNKMKYSKELQRFLQPTSFVNSSSNKSRRSDNFRRGSSEASVLSE